MHYLGEKTVIRAPTEPRTSPWFKVGEHHVINKAGDFYIEVHFRLGAVSPRQLRHLQTGVQLACFINGQRMGRIKNFDLLSSEITEGELFALAEGDKWDYRIRKEYGDDLTMVLDNIQITVLEYDTGLTPRQIEVEDEYE